MISFSPSGLKRSKWWEYLLRFALGGLVTAAAGFIAKLTGPEFGGLFLAFPAILAASATLVSKHERERKQQKHLNGIRRGRQAAAADAAGAAMGSVGLIGFAAFVWHFLPDHTPWLVIALATLVWALLSVATWLAWKKDLLQRPRSAASKYKHS